MVPLFLKTAIGSSAQLSESRSKSDELHHATQAAIRHAWRQVFNPSGRCFLMTWMAEVADVPRWMYHWDALAMKRHVPLTWLHWQGGVSPASPSLMQCSSSLLLCVLTWPWMLHMFTKRRRKSGPFFDCYVQCLLHKKTSLKTMQCEKDRVKYSNWNLNVEQVSTSGTLKVHACRINTFVPWADVRKAANALKFNAYKAGHLCARDGGCAACPVAHLQHSAVLGEEFQPAINLLEMQSRMWELDPLQKSSKCVGVLPLR